MRKQKPNPTPQSQRPDTKPEIELPGQHDKPPLTTPTDGR
jgi:hypothetical protein